MDNFKKPPKKKKPKLEPSQSLGKPVINNSGPKLAGPENPTPKATEMLQDVETIDLSIDEPSRKSNKTQKKDTKLSAKTKKMLLIGLPIVFLIVAGAAGFYLYQKQANNKPFVTTQSTAAPEKPKAQPLVSPLSGRIVPDAALTKRPVTGLMIENSPDARPQSGLTDADMVVEAIAEAGITRFLALYQESQPQYIGPIRSVRPYYLDYAMPLQASIGHVGGSPEALQDIKTLGARDLDQFFNPSGYWRTTDRYAPHNMYTSFEKIDKLNQAKGYSSSSFTGFTRKEGVPQTPTAKSIDLAISGPMYSPHFDYNVATNNYGRSQAGKPHNDLKSGKQISPSAVVVLVVSSGVEADGYHNAYTTSGTGKAYVFQDGIVSQGNWDKKDRKGKLSITDSNGLPMKINSGQTWISLVGTSADVEYKP